MPSLFRGSLPAAVLSGLLALGLGACAGSDTTSGPIGSPGQGGLTPTPPTPPTPPPSAGPGTPPGASVEVTVAVPNGLNAAPFDVTRKLRVPPGFSIEVVARVPKARFMAVGPDGEVLVSQPDHGGVRILKPRTGQLWDDQLLFSGLNKPHDLVFHTINGIRYLYVAEQDKISRYRWDDGRPGARQEIVVGLPSLSSPELGGQYGHYLKNIAIEGDRLYVSIASRSNADPADLQATPKMGAIYLYRTDQTGQTATSGRLFAQGIRNAEGLAIAPGTTDLWVVVNNRDRIRYPYDRDYNGYEGPGSDYGKEIQAYVDDHPPEEIIRVRDGKHYGWPFCNPNPDTPSGMRTMPFDRDYETNRDGSALNCSTEATPIDMGIQAHSAPLGMSFWTSAPEPYRNAMVVGLHGCWNCSKLAEGKIGHKVSLFPYANGTLGNEVDLVTGFIGSAGFSTRWGRPVDAVPYPDGSLLISDDMADALYRLKKQ